jgi:hypothetical protein
MRRAKRAQIFHDRNDEAVPALRRRSLKECWNAASSTSLEEAMLKNIREVDRHISTSREPHAVAADRNTLWISSRVTRKVDVIDPASWKKVGELEPPGMAWGMTFAGGDVIMTCGESDDDNRRIRRYRGNRFVDGFIACPDDTGSHLAVTGGRVVLGQWYNRKLLVLNDDGSLARAYDTPHQVCGVVITDGSAHVLGTDEEENGDYYISRMDLESGAAQDLALVPFRARGLAWDGSRFWTNHREADRTVSFDLPA